MIFYRWPRLGLMNLNERLPAFGLPLRIDLVTSGSHE